MAPHRTPNSPPDRQLKGTLVSVLLVGAVILLIWVGVFAIFAVRNS